MYYQFDKNEINGKLVEIKASLAENKPDAEFVEFSTSVIYQRLKKNILHYRQYGPYWWALKDVLRRQNYNVGNETDSRIEQAYQGDNDEQTIVMADLFYMNEAPRHTVDNMDWLLEKNQSDYRLFDEDMEMRPSITDRIF